MPTPRCVKYGDTSDEFHPETRWQSSINCLPRKAKLTEDSVEFSSYLKNTLNECSVHMQTHTNTQTCQNRTLTIPSQDAIIGWFFYCLAYGDETAFGNVSVYALCINIFI